MGQGRPDCYTDTIHAVTLILRDPFLAHELWLYLLAVLALATGSAEVVGVMGLTALVAYLTVRTLDRRAHADEVAIDLARALAVAHAAGDPPAASFSVVARLLDLPEPEAADAPLPRGLAGRLGAHASPIARLLAAWPAADTGARLQALARWISESGAARRVLEQRARPRHAIRIAWATVAVAGLLVQQLLLARGSAQAPSLLEAQLALAWAFALGAQAWLLERIRWPAARVRVMVDGVLDPGEAAPDGKTSARPETAAALEERMLDALEVHRAGSLRAIEGCRIAATLAGIAPVLLAMVHPLVKIQTAVIRVAAGLR